MTMLFFRFTNTRLVFGLAGIFVFAAGRMSTQAQPADLSATNQPNIIFILADDLGCGDLGCYGPSDIKTPNLDQLAANGIRFTSFYAGSPIGSQSRQTYLLGQHTGHLTVPPVDAPSASQPTIAELLQQAGYHTGCIGEWDMPGVPQKQGFAVWAGLLTEVEAQCSYPPYLWRYDPGTGYDGRMEFPGNSGTSGTKAASDIFTTAAINFIKINKPDPFNKYRPFFLFLGYNSPRAAQTDGSTPEKARAAANVRLDADIGKILDTLKATRQESNTVIVITSDNAPHRVAMVEPKTRNNTGSASSNAVELSEADLRVPLIINCPGKIIANNLSDQPWAAWDVLPTLAEMGRAPSLARVDGISFWPLLTGQAQTRRHDFLYWELRDDHGLRQAARMGAWKAVISMPGKPAELYDLKNDAAESTDLAMKNPGELGKLEEFLKKFQHQPPR